MLQTLDSEIRAHVDAFTSDLTTIIRRSALEAVEERITASTSRTSPGGTPSGRSKVDLAIAMSALRAGHDSIPYGPVSAEDVPSGKKRDPRTLARLVDRLHDYIRKNAGQRMETIGKAIGLPTSALTLPIKKLLRDKRIVATGVKRATTYSAVSP